MDMKINAQKLVQLRQSKAWSQQHLADVSGLSLRTVQRIEKTQSASQDSVKALAAAFETTPQTLLQADAPIPTVSQNSAMTLGSIRNAGILTLAILSIVVVIYGSQSVVATDNPQSSASMAQGSPQNHESIEHAKQWLRLIDNNDYQISWQKSSPFFQHQVSKQKWEQAMLAVRQPLGGLIERKHASTKTTSAMPGLPDGQYVVLTFSTKFENKASAIIETLTLNKANGDWQPLGYFIR